MLACAAIAGCAASWAAYPVSQDVTLLVLVAVAIVADLATLTFLRGADIATSFPMTIACLVLFGPTAAAVLSALVAVVTDLARFDRTRSSGESASAMKSIFNASQVALGVLAGGWTYVALGGPVVASSRAVAAVPDSAFANWSAFVLPLLAASVAVVAVNVVLIVVVLWLSEGSAPGATVRALGIPEFTLVLVSLGLVGLAVAAIMVNYNWFGLLVFAVPLLTVRQIFQHFARLQRDYPATVRILVRSIEAKDEYTRGHSERVADYAVRFARYLGLKDAETETIQFAAMLHDLGKMGVRAEILNKPARLDDAEYAEMKAHPVAALEIVSRIPDTDGLLPIIRHHHERIDGGGYPDGIAGSAIPFASRLLAVCDTYDAMTSSRPYRPALSRGAAVGELRHARGTQLDSELAREFIAMLESAREGDPPNA
jgi:hypothetical protein